MKKKEQEWRKWRQLSEFFNKKNCPCHGQTNKHPHKYTHTMFIYSCIWEGAGHASIYNGHPSASIQHNDYWILILVLLQTLPTWKKKKYACLSIAYMDGHFFLLTKRIATLLNFEQTYVNYKIYIYKWR